MKFPTKVFSLLAGVALTVLPAGSAHAAPASSEPVQVAQNYNYNVRPSITGMAFLNGKTLFSAGETMQVVLNGTPGGIATFDITGVQSNIPMREVSRGRYVGTLQVHDGMAVNNAKLRGRLRVGNRQTTHVAAGGVTIAGIPGYNQGYYPQTAYPQAGYPQGYPQVGYPQTGYPYAPGAAYAPGQMFVNVTSPSAGQPVGRLFTVTGQTVPFAQVQITARSQRSLIPGVVNLGTQTVNAAGVADANGHFAIPVNLTSGGGNILGNVIGGSNSNIDLRVVATDPRTNASRQVQYNIATGGY